MSINRCGFLFMIWLGMITVSFTTIPKTISLEGIYENMNKNTKSVTKVIITCKGKALFIETFVKCKNQTCNWKKTVLKKVGKNEYEATYAQGFAKKTLRIFQKGKQLIIHTERTYKDSRPTSNVTDTLRLVKVLKKC